TEAGEVVRAVPDLQRIFTQTLEPTRQLDLYVPVDGPAEKRLRGGDRDRQVAVAGDDDLFGAVLAGEPFPLGLADDDRCARLDDRELLHCDRLPRGAEHLGVLEGD